MSLNLYYVGVFVASLLLSLSATPLAKRVALRLDFVDRPGGRKIHSIVTPYLGGVAIYVGFVAAVACVVGFEKSMLEQSASLLAGATILLGFGLVDDRTGMDPRLKLAGQILAALVAIVSGISFHLTGAVPVDLAISLVWIVGLSNAVNLLDNMDGLSGGLVTIAASFLFLLAAQGGQFLVASMAAALMGACLGFLRYNFSPATIFMGDAGSLFLGFTLAVLAMKLRLPHSDLLNFFITVLVLALPILDTTLVTVHRIANGRKVYLGGQDHCSHRLVALGLSRRNAVLLLYALALGYGAAAMTLDLWGADVGWLMAALAVLVTTAVFAKLGSVAVYKKEAPAAAGDEAPELVAGRAASERP